MYSYNRRHGWLLVSLLLIAALSLGRTPDSAAAPLLPADAPLEPIELLSAGFSPGEPPAILRLNPNVSSHRTPPPDSAQAALRAVTANITVNYLPAGAVDLFGTTCLAWPAQAQTAFTYAAGIWATLISSPVTIVIHACWADLPEGILGYAAADRFYLNFAGAPATNTWYPSALANAFSGSDLDPSRPDMHLAYNKRFLDSNQWYFGADGNTPATRIDFVTVVLHEIAHGLGFSGSMQISSGQGRWGLGTPYPISYDRFTEDGSGNALINTAVYPNPSTALAAALTSDNVWFDGPNATAANGGGRVKLYAPSTWQQGSSYAHLDEIYNGTPNALMTYSLSLGESNHSPGPVGLAILRDVGWTTTASTSTPVVTAVVPGSSPNTGAVAVSITGLNFQTGATAKLTRSDQPDINATSVMVISPTQITGEFDLAGAAAGLWSVVVTNPGAQSATLTNGFLVTSNQVGSVYLPAVFRQAATQPSDWVTIASNGVEWDFP